MKNILAVREIVFVSHGRVEFLERIFRITERQYGVDRTLLYRRGKIIALNPLVGYFTVPLVPRMDS